MINGLRQVGNRTMKQFGVITKVTETEIALMTQQAANMGTDVAMIDGQPFLGNPPTDSALPILQCEQDREISRRNPGPAQRRQLFQSLDVASVIGAFMSRHPCSADAFAVNRPLSRMSMMPFAIVGIHRVLVQCLSTFGSFLEQSFTIRQIPSARVRLLLCHSATVTALG